MVILLKQSDETRPFFGMMCESYVVGDDGVITISKDDHLTGIVTVSVDSWDMYYEYDTHDVAKAFQMFDEEFPS